VALVLGLGNPGARYARTRHNVGWRVLEALVDRWEAAPGEGGPLYRSWRAERGGTRVDLVAPLTFMNRCGEALAAWRERHGIEPAGLLVVADDVYLPLGCVRLRARGSSGGHLGLEGVEAALASRDYARLRLGVGAAEDAAALRRHVLEEFAEEEEEQVEQAVRVAADAVECWRGEGMLAAMNRFNRRVRKEVSEP
jgi:PTH1 family peptidyl-tRNA hydrolase